MPLSRMPFKKDDESGFSLLELMIVCALLLVVLSIVGNFLINANRAVAVSVARAQNNNVAQNIVNRLNHSVQVADPAWISSDGTTLWVVNNPAYTGGTEASCETWTFGGGQLSEATPAGSSTVAIKGVGPAGEGVPYFTTSRSVDGLVGVQFAVAAPGVVAGAVTVDDSLHAANMAAPVTVWPGTPTRAPSGCAP
ncbi:MAG: PulJ/GspJ family protein [Acidimicrobiales bacterium]